MSHLLTFRKGWQSEHLARYILSKFSFVAEPSNISDDIGSDFFCTVFSIQDNIFLLPQNSIAIQIKSNKDEIDVSNKLEYLMNIEIPYFIGCINKKEHNLTIYSGESIPHFFSKFGNPSNLPHKTQTIIKLIEKRENDLLFSTLDQKTFYLYFPKILVLSADFEYEKDINYLDSFKDCISKMQKNISAEISYEYMFDFIDNTGVAVYAGPGSANTYRENLCKRLCEAFFNVEFISNSSGKIRVTEFRAYENLLKDIERIYGGIPTYLFQIYSDVKTRLGL